MTDTWPMHNLILILPIETPVEASLLGTGWKPGPLPLELPGGAVTNAQTRATYFDARTVDMLYGRNPMAGRFHLAPVEHRLNGRWTVRSCELLTIEFSGLVGTAKMILHLEASGLVDVRSLSEIARLSAPEHPIKEFLRSGLGTAFRLEGNPRRAFTLAFASANPGSPDITALGVNHWSTLQAELWLLASATPPERYQPPSHVPPEKVIGDVNYLSADWAVLVLRDGASFVYLTDNEQFLVPASIYVATIYLDALLLGLIQDAVLRKIADATSRLVVQNLSPKKVLTVESAFAEFRMSLWWNNVTTHGVGNDLMAALQRQRRLPALHDQIVAQLRDLSRQTLLHSELAGAEASASTNRLLALLAVLGIPLAVGSFVSSFMGPGWATVWTAIVFTVASTIALAALPETRGLIRKPSDPIARMETSDGEQ